MQGAEAWWEGGLKADSGGVAPGPVHLCITPLPPVVEPAQPGPGPSAYSPEVSLRESFPCSCSRRHGPRASHPCPGPQPLPRRFILDSGSDEHVEVKMGQVAWAPALAPLSMEPGCEALPQFPVFYDCELSHRSPRWPRRVPGRPDLQPWISAGKVPPSHLQGWKSPPRTGSKLGQLKGRPALQDRGLATWTQHCPPTKAVVGVRQASGVKLGWGSPETKQDHPKSRSQVPVVAQRVTNLTSIHEDGGLIPSLTQWVKDPVLP